MKLSNILRGSKAIINALYRPPIEKTKILCNNNYLMAQCLAGNGEDAKVRVQRNIFDENLNMFFQHYCDIYVSDPNNLAKSGDYVLIKKLDEKLTLEIEHEVVRVLMQLGNTVDPITGRPCVTTGATGKFMSHVYPPNCTFRDEQQMLDKQLGHEDDEDRFDWDKAPDRGWQEGKKDYSHREAYNKYHEFEHGHPLHKDPAAFTDV